MAIRRMFSKEVICTDVFLEMPLSAQALYFHFGMQADDDGFVGNPSTIKRMVGASNDDYKLLIAKEFIIPFQNGVVVIRHWKIHNAIRKDRYKETVYKEQKALINSGNDSAYIFSGLPCDNQTATKQQPTVDKWETQVRLGKDSIGKDSVGKDSIGKDSVGKDSVGKDSVEVQSEKDTQHLILDCTNLVEVFNSICKSYTPINSIDPFTNHLSNCLLQGFEYKDIQDAFEKAEKSAFLRGEVNKDFKACLGWILTPKNLKNILDGNYDD